MGVCSQQKSLPNTTRTLRDRMHVSTTKSFKSILFLMLLTGAVHPACSFFGGMLLTPSVASAHARVQFHEREPDRAAPRSAAGERLRSHPPVNALVQFAEGAGGGSRLDVVAAREQIVDELLSTLWAGRDGHCTSDREEAIIDAVSGEFSSTYGEITAAGFRGLAKRIDLSPADFFVDLGSGVGRTVVQAALEFGCQQSHGVELSPSRHERAQRALVELLGRQDALHRLMTDGGMGSAKTLLIEGVRLREGNLLEFPVGFATVCWVASLCFSDDFMDAVSEKLATEASSLRAIVSLSAFPAGVRGFDLLSDESDRFEMSWTQSRGGKARVFIYIRKE